MEKIPLEILATVSKYLQIIDIFSLLHLNRSFNFLWTSFEYWSIVCGGRKNFLELLANEFNCVLEDLRLFNMNKNNQNDLVENDKDEYFGFDLNTLAANLQNLNSFNQNTYCTKFADKSVIWKIFIRRKLQSWNLIQLISIFQDINIYKCDKKIIAIFSPLIAVISNHFLEIYELRNYSYSGKISSNTANEKLIYTKKKLITRINLNLLEDSKDSSCNNNIALKARTTKIIKWAFFDKNTIFCVTKDYGIYFYEIDNFSKRIVLKKPSVNHSNLPKVIIFEISGNLLAIGLEDGSLDIWKLCSGYKNSNFSGERWLLVHYSTIHYEHIYSRKSLIDFIEELPSPLTWVNISHTCNILLAIYKGIVNEIRIFSIYNLDLNNKPILINKIPLNSDIHMCQIDPKGRFIICVDSNKEIYPKTRFYSLSSGKLLLMQNFRIICPLFTPCGHLMIGAYRAHLNNPIEKSLNTIKSFKTTSKYINAEFMNCYFISIWSIPSFKEIYSFNCGESEQIINIRFSRTRASTSIVTTTINRNSSGYIGGPMVKTSSNIYFISNEIFTCIKPLNLTYFF
ncbi:uncharacterized protein cubi_00233 [Cryptosporidium ubiquitum]|uniref:F-box domain-containing protein n=1 Tax=Cryptosporidium ubiquitum TaxID=857276 RepID=A0A1J4MKE1_9CRYT|nr:uncharacterized protein cubi_00233 [Cryptosporidium ubiquitum]OII74680.1 hypothetical protein cubi_00233 [Cryptosporidium ubiquitum]